MYRRNALLRGDPVSLYTREDTHVYNIQIAHIRSEQVSDALLPSRNLGICTVVHKFG
jgi:hypothetical protein